MMPAFAVSVLLSVFSVLIPTKVWFAPNQPITVNVKAAGDVTLVLTDFAGKKLDPSGSADVGGEKQVDVKELFPAVTKPGTYVLYAVNKGKEIDDFQGTPIVIEVRSDRRMGAPAGPMVVRIEPLRYATIETDHGPLTAVFYYDVAPNTADNFLSLAEGGYFDGLTFHRIVPGFVIQGGDPRGDGTGGPGYSVPAEFNARPHVEGALSMARSSDPDSAGSQFFVCLDYQNTRQLDGKYTVFGAVTEGLDAVKKIAATPLADPDNGKPATPQMIKSVKVVSVTKDTNPYKALLSGK